MEMAIVILVFLMLVFGILEFGRVVFEWSKLVEATRAGARYAIVNDPACNIFGTPWEAGDPQYLKRACDVEGSGTKYLVCDGGTQEVYTTIDGDCSITSSSEHPQDAACKIVSEHLLEVENGNVEVEEIRGNMRGIQSLINSSTADVTITYTCTDAGFAGNAQKVPAVTVEVNNVPYYFIVPGVLGIDASVTMPPFSTTRTGEDLNWIRYDK